MSKVINIGKLYSTTHFYELYCVEHHLQNSYLSNLLKTPEAIEKYTEQLQFLKKYDRNHSHNEIIDEAYRTLRVIFSEFGYIDEWTMRECINDVNKYIKAKRLKDETYTFENN